MHQVKTLYCQLTGRITSKVHTVQVCLSGIIWGNELKFGKYSPDESFFFFPYWHSLPLTVLPPVLPASVFVFSHLLTPPLLFCLIFLFVTSVFFCSPFSFSFCGMCGERLLSQGLWGTSVDRFRIQQEDQPYHIGSDQTIRKDIHSLFCFSYKPLAHCLLSSVCLVLLLVPLMFLLLCVSFIFCIA